jgi:hypothetical protein
MSDDVTRREAISKLAATAGIGALLAATAGTARAKTTLASETVHHEAKGDELHVEWGIVNKPKEGALSIEFKKRFADPPVVLLTPFWEGQNTSVGFVETLDHVSHSEFNGRWARLRLS